METIRFAKTNAILIKAQNIRSLIKSRIKNITNIYSNYKNYKYLNEGNKNIIMDNITDYQFTPVSFGKKFMLFLTKIDNKKYTIMINKKKKDLISIEMELDDALYDNTLLDGELYKLNDKWIYQVNDLFIYNNINYRFKSLDLRIKILQSIFETNYDYATFKIILVEHYTLNYFIDCIENKNTIFKFKTSGILFKNINNNKNYLYIYKENRTKTKKFIFNVEKTNLPDVYKLYCKNNNKIVEHSIAAIPNLETSQKLKQLFSETEEILRFECSYSKSFNKYVPLKITDESLTEI